MRGSTVSGPGGTTLWGVAVLALTAVLAAWADLSPLHRFHNSDSLVPILVSLDLWTPFYWEQNRFGMLLPLLALPVRDPFANLLVQVGLRLLALFLSFFLLARTVVPRPWWPAAGALTLGLFLVGKDLAEQNFQQMQPYFQAMALALGGVMLLERAPRTSERTARTSRTPRTPGTPGRPVFFVLDVPAVLAVLSDVLASLLIALAFWVSPATLFWFVPLLLLRRVLGLGGRLLLPLGVAGVSFVAVLLAARWSEYQGTDLGFARIADWPRGWLVLALNAGIWLGPALLLALAVLLLASLLVYLRDEKGRLALAAGLCLLGTAAAELLILGTTGWVHLNGFRVRFLSTVLLALATTGPALLLGLLLKDRPARWGRVANALALALLLPLALWRYGLPSPAAARAALDAGPETAAAREIADAGCTHVLGDYWRVWPAVFQSRVLLRERGEERKVWGITYRSTPTRDLWWPQDWAEARIAVLGTPGQIQQARTFYHLPVVSFRRFCPGPAAATSLPEELETR